MKSNSKLASYIKLLMSNDDALRKFVQDPIAEAEEKYGLTKAERAVLRRTVAHLSNRSVNGYSMERSLGSYRRSLRLLQNVLDNHAAKVVQDGTMLNLEQNSAPVHYLFSINVYYPNGLSQGDHDFTCQSNSDVNAVGGPYSDSTFFYSCYLANPNPTIKEVMDNINQNQGNPFAYETVTNASNELFISQITVNGITIKADLSNDCYDLSKNPDADSVFWFYTINGTPNKGHTPVPGGHPGAEGQSFADYKLSVADVVSWQLIAPDATYGFAPCEPGIIISKKS